MRQWLAQGNSASESAPNPRGVEFVRGSDYDEWEDMLITAARRVNERLRAKGLLASQQEPKSKDE